jgi:AraC-like DNA-binding protein
MAEKIYGDIDISSIASQLGISVSRLNDIFKTYTSMTPYSTTSTSDSRGEKPARAGRSLGQGVAYRLGFEDQYQLLATF